MQEWHLGWEQLRRWSQAHVIWIAIQSFFLSHFSISPSFFNSNILCFSFFLHNLMIYEGRWTTTTICSSLISQIGYSCFHDFSHFIAFFFPLSTIPLSTVTFKLEIRVIFSYQKISLSLLGLSKKNSPQF